MLHRPWNCSLVRPAFLVLWLIAGAAHPALGEPELLPRQSRPFKFRLPDDALAAYTFRLPADAAGLIVRLRGVTAAVKLRLHAGDSLPEGEDPGLGQIINPDDYDQILIASRYVEPDLAPGEYTLEVSYETAGFPIVGGKTVDVVTGAVELAWVPESAAATVVAGASVTHPLSWENAGTAILRVTLPEKGKTLRLDIAETQGDLQMVAAPGKVPRQPHRAPYQALTTRGRESLRVPVEGVSEVFAVIFQESIGEYPVSFTLATSLSEEPAADLLAIPALPELSAASPAIQKALRASVEIFSEGGGGSGTLIGEGGWVLTNWHVVTDPATKDPTPTPVAIGVTLDLERPSREMFLAKVEKVDRVRDVALLRITSGLYGQPLPAGYRFPGVQPAYDASARLRIGELLSQVGYPAVGGSETRPTISVTRSEVAGFVWHPHGRVIKVGGGIFPGNSGGGSYTEKGEFVGLPTAVVGGAEDGGAMGYVHPVTLIPEDWRKAMEE